MFGNFAAQAGVIAGRKFASVTIEWNFNDTLVFGFSPFPSNINDRPRINTFRSDGTNLYYMSGGRYVFYPPFSPTGQIFEPWGDRRTGLINLNIPLVGNTYAGVDAFIPSGINVIFEPALGTSGWQKIASIENEDQYQYILNIGNNPKLKINIGAIQNNFWDFSSDPSGKSLTNFSVNYSSFNNSGIVIANWNDESSPTKLISNTGYSHTFN
jgi:hypothetical protein